MADYARVARPISAAAAGVAAACGSRVDGADDARWAAGFDEFPLRRERAFRKAISRLPHVPMSSILSFSPFLYRTCLLIWLTHFMRNTSLFLLRSPRTPRPAENVMATILAHEKLGAFADACHHNYHFHIIFCASLRSHYCSARRADDRTAAARGRIAQHHAPACHTFPNCSRRSSITPASIGLATIHRR